MATTTWDLAGNTGNSSSACLGTTDGQPVIVKTANTERLRVDAEGNVGIGTATPGAKLGVVSATVAPAVVATCAFGIAVRAQSTRDTGMFSTSDAGMGVDARSNTNIGLSASSTSNIAVRAAAQKNTALFATSDVGVGVDARSNSSVGVQAISQSNTAVLATSTSGLGIDARSAQGIAIRAQAQSDTGVFTTSTAGRGIDARSTAGIGVYGEGGQFAGYFHGNIMVTGDVMLSGADCAEQFDVVTENGVPDPGTVLVIDRDGRLRESTEAYDRRVAGIVSGAGEHRHAIVLDSGHSGKDRVPIALVGKVYCKVDAQYGPIDVGDLLTSSPTPGHAMKASSSDRAPGAVLGKALRALAHGAAMIPVLVALQ